MILTLQGLGIAAASLTAVIVAIKTLTSWSPARWVFKQLVTDPMREEMEGVIDDQVSPAIIRTTKDIAELRASVQHLHASVSQVLREVTLNGGSSLKDMTKDNQQEIQALRQDYAALAVHLGWIERPDAGPEAGRRGGSGGVGDR